MVVVTKKFTELTLEELYMLLQLRSEVFVVEQECAYQDLDGKDQKAFHVLGYRNSNLVAYTRIFKPGDYFKEAAIGRVVVRANERQHKYGYDVMNASLKFIEESLKTKSVRLSAQTYLKKFYINLGFSEVGAEYLEDGIPHINMLKS